MVSTTEEMNFKFYLNLGSVYITSVASGYCTGQYRVKSFVSSPTWNSKLFSSSATESSSLLFELRDIMNIEGGDTILKRGGLPEFETLVFFFNLTFQKVASIFYFRA